MKIVYSLDSIQRIKKVFITFGKFATLHTGHVVTLKKLVIESKKRKSKSVVVCFKKSNFLEQKTIIRILKKIGIDFLVYLNLKPLKKMTFAQFLYFLTQRINLAGIVGSDKMTIGYQKRGNYLNIKNYCKRYFPKIVIISIPSTKGKIKNISSSDIYSLLQQEFFRQANQILTIPFNIQQKVISGKKIGRTIDYSTINLSYPKKFFTIPEGVYATYLLYRCKIYHSMTFWGSSFNDSHKKLESHIFDFNETIYNQTIILFFVEKIREKVKINNVVDLKKILSQDEKISKEILANNLIIKKKIQKYF